MKLTQENFDEWFNSGELIHRTLWDKVERIIPMRKYKDYYFFIEYGSEELVQIYFKDIITGLKDEIFYTTNKEAWKKRKSVLINYIKVVNINKWSNDPIIIDEDNGALVENEEEIKIGDNLEGNKEEYNIWYSGTINKPEVINAEERASNQLQKNYNAAYDKIAEQKKYSVTTEIIDLKIPDLKGFKKNVAETYFDSKASGFEDKQNT